MNKTYFWPGIPPGPDPQSSIQEHGPGLIRSSRPYCFPSPARPPIKAKSPLFVGVRACTSRRSCVGAIHILSLTQNGKALISIQSETCDRQRKTADRAGQGRVSGCSSRHDETGRALCEMVERQEHRRFRGRGPGADERDT